MGNALSKKDIQSLFKKKILDRWSISFSLMGEIGVYLSHLQQIAEFFNKNLTLGHRAFQIKKNLSHWI